MSHLKGVLKLTFPAVAPRQGEGLKLETSALKLVMGDQFTSSTQLKILNYPVILSHQRSTTVSLETYPRYHIPIDFSSSARSSDCNLKTKATYGKSLWTQSAVLYTYTWHPVKKWPNSNFKNTSFYLIVFYEEGHKIARSWRLDFSSVKTLLKQPPQ